MAKNIWYSTPLKFFWHVLYGTQKKLTPEIPDDQIFNLLRNNLLKLPFAVDETKEDRGLMISGLELWRDDLLGKILHIYFLDKELFSFLERTPLSDLDGIIKYMKENGEFKEVVHLYSNSSSKNLFFKFGLHLPYESDGYAFSLCLEEGGSIELYFSHGKNGGRISDKFYQETNKMGDDVSKTLSSVFRLAINTIAYMNCFPDCVEDGVPKNLFDRGESLNAKNYTFQVSDRIKDVDESKLSRIPHFRKGHFRYLQSDYFVNKKGQIVFVAETMVKGKAKSVSMTNEADKFGKESDAPGNA